MSSSFDVDCTAYCKFTSHGNILTKCLTKRVIDEEKLISYLVLCCGNFCKNLDENGRSALHVACSNSKPIVAEFLLDQGANLHQKDLESAFTPLHRAIHYLDLEIVVLLKRYGASFDLLDSDFYTPLQLIPEAVNLSSCHSIETNAFVWGKNKNYNIGLCNITSRAHPDAIKNLPPVLKASINKYHSLFLTSTGALWGCGHSKDGRLGVGAGSESTLTCPQEIRVKLNSKSERIVGLSCGLHHSLIYTNKCAYATGSNKHLQLGIKNVDFVSEFKEVPLDKTEVDFKRMLDVLACDFHSLFVSRSGVFICGLNVGQFGGIQESIAVPRRLPYPSSPNLEVEWANSNNCCICAYLSDKKCSYLYIFYNRKIKTFKNPLNEKLTKCAISGGEILYNSEDVLQHSSQKPLTITILTEYWNLYIFYDDIMQFVKVNFSSIFTQQITSISSCGDDLLILANSHLFQASLQHKVPKMYQLESDYQEHSTKRDIAQFICSKVTIKRIQHLANVREVCTDTEGESFIALLKHIALRPKDIEKEVYDFSMLLDGDSGLQPDSRILDVEFTFNRLSIRASRFVVASRCEYLRKLMKLDQQKSESCVIDDQRLTPDIFNCILIWIYKNALNEGDVHDSIRNMSEKDQNTFANNFLNIALDWGLNDLYETIRADRSLSKFLPKLKQEAKSIKKFKWFSPDALPQLYDVTIILDENQRIQAHKVVLMSRIEYFRLMFFHNWSENTEVDLRHISVAFMRPIVQFAYDNNADSLRNAKFTDNFMYNMCAILDQYLIENVKNIFESMIMKKVNLRNCAENLEFSFMYNCDLLKDYCMEFICINLSRLLEGNVLVEALDNDILKQLSAFYRKYFNFEEESSRIITPAFDAPTDEEIEEKIQGFDFAAYNELAQQTLKNKSPPKSKSRLSKSELLRRGYEKEGIKNIKVDEEKIETTATKLSESDKSADVEKYNFDWHQNRERKDSGKRKSAVASKCNDILKNEAMYSEPMTDLRNLRISPPDDETGSSRTSLTLADFVFKDKRKSAPLPLPKVEEKKEATTAWNMNSIELKPVNTENSDPFKLVKEKKATTNGKAEKKFSSIIRDERKDKSNFEKIKSKSLILTQIEEKAIIELSQFYNIDNIFDENIKIHRKEHQASQNLSQWQFQTKTS